MFQLATDTRAHASIVDILPQQLCTVLWFHAASSHRPWSGTSEDKARPATANDQRPTTSLPLLESWAIELVHHRQPSSPLRDSRTAKPLPARPCCRTLHPLHRICRPAPPDVARALPETRQQDSTRQTATPQPRTAPLHPLHRPPATARRDACVLEPSADCCCLSPLPLAAAPGRSRGCHAVSLRRPAREHGRRQKVTTLDDPEQQQQRQQRALPPRKLAARPSPRQ